MNCPNCNHQAPLLEFLLEAKDFNFFECSECHEISGVGRGDNIPECCDQSMRLVARKEFDIARCPECEKVAKVEYTVRQFPRS